MTARSLGYQCSRRPTACALSQPRLRAAAFVLVAVVSAGAFPLNTLAEGSSSSLINRFRIADPRGPDGAVVPAIEESESASTDAELTALYDQALKELAAGHFASAQRMFEQFVAASPDHPLAPEARRQLAELYRTPVIGEDGSSPKAPAATGSIESGPRLAAAPESAPVPRPAEPVVREPGLPVAAAVEDKFVREAGDRVFFSAGSAELGSRARAVLSSQVQWLRSERAYDIVVEGHADDPPMLGEKLHTLAKTRAETVRQRLIEEGIAAERVSIASFGRDRRIAPCDSPDCSAQNRRAVTVLMRRARVQQGTLGGRSAR